jgi:hypothetical protein
MVGDDNPLCDGSLFALVACQRSGSHLLREILNSNPAIALLSEPFSRDPEPANWHNFAATLPPHEYPPPLPADAAALLDRYVDLIQRDVDDNSDWYGGRKSSRRMIGLDVKYNQLRSIGPMYLDLRAEPFLLDYFRLRGFRIVHLIRANLLQAAISAVISNARRVWQNYDGGVIDGRYQISPFELIGYMRWMKAEREEFMRLAADLPVHVCVFEDLVEDLRRVDAEGVFPANTQTLRPLAAFLGVKNKFRHGGKIHKVINRPYADIIDNYDELVRAVERSEFCEFAGTLCA